MDIVRSAAYDYIEYKKLIDALCDKYGFLKRTVIGKSCTGLAIPALKIGSASEYCLFAAAFHGSEHLTATVLMMFIEELCREIANGGYISGINAKKAMTGRGVIFVPRVNPDGCEISIHGEKACGSEAERIKRLSRGDFAHWNANFRGVDINHNFDAGWKELKRLELNNGIYGPSPTRYGGERPESEPETIALTELCRKQNIRHAVALHSQGEVIYWSYGRNMPSRSKKMAEIMATSSGYALDTPIGIAVGGGFKDWFIKEFCRPGFTVELGMGQNPLPPESAEEIYLKVREMLMLCSIM